MRGIPADGASKPSSPAKPAGSARPRSAPHQICSWIVCAQLAPPPHLMRGAVYTALGSLPVLSCFAAVPTGSGWLGFSIGARGRIDGVLGGSGARTKYPANGMPQTIEVLRVRRSGVSQNDPPANGMRGMIEGLLGRRTGVSRGRRLHHVGRNCPLLGIGRVPTGSGWFDFSVAVGGLVASFLVTLAPIEGLPTTRRQVSGPRASPFRHHAHFAWAWRSVGARGLLATGRERAGRRSRSWPWRDRGGPGLTLKIGPAVPARRWRSRSGRRGRARSQKVVRAAPAARWAPSGRRPLASIRAVLHSLVRWLLGSRGPLGALIRLRRARSRTHALGSGS